MRECVVHWWVQKQRERQPSIPVRSSVSASRAAELRSDLCCTLPPAPSARGEEVSTDTAHDAHSQRTQNVHFLTVSTASPARRAWFTAVLDFAAAAFCGLFLSTVTVSQSSLILASVCVCVFKGV